MAPIVHDLFPPNSGLSAFMASAEPYGQDIAPF